MATISRTTESCMRSFAVLCHEIERRDDSTPFAGDMAEEFGRFKIWTGNLGALAKGHSALDWRLRDADIMRSTVLSLLQELNNALELAIEFLRDDSIPGAGATEDCDLPDDISLPSDDELDAISQPGNALSYTTQRIQDLIKDLYRLSFRIRNSTSKPTRAAHYKENDASSGLELFGDCYASFDEIHVRELFRSLRKSSPSSTADDEILILRFATSNTTRRRQFRYWQQHAQKLIATDTSAPATNNAVRLDSLGQLTKLPSTAIAKSSSRPMQSTHAKSMFTTTEATFFDPKLDLTPLETQSVVSLATTARDLEGTPADLPQPPAAAITGKDFICPYCLVLCPSSHGQGRAWRKHILQDLQPYLCTYSDCTSTHNLYGSRSEWLEHEEMQHRKVWFCRFHPSLQFPTQHALEQHLRHIDHSNMTENQTLEFASIAHVVAEDARSHCPVCLRRTLDIPHFLAHLANHLERIAIFSLPRLLDSDESSLASFKAAPQSMSDRDSLPSVLSSTVSLESGHDDELFHYRRDALRDDIVQWLLDFAVTDVHEELSGQPEPRLFQTFLQSTGFTSWCDGPSPQRLICCGPDRARLKKFTSAVVDELKLRAHPSGPTTSLFIPSQFSEGSEVKQILANLLGQLIANGPVDLISSELFGIYEYSVISQSVPSQSTIARLLTPVIRSYSRVYLVAGDSTWDKVWFKLSHACPGNLSLLVYTTNFEEPTPVLVCDHCDQLTDVHWHCTICNGGDFDLCSTCKARGLLCLDPSHDLILFDATKDQIVVDVDSFYPFDLSQQNLAQKLTSQMISLHQSHPADAEQRYLLINEFLEDIMVHDLQASKHKDLAMGALEVVNHTRWPLKDNQFEDALRHILQCRSPHFLLQSSTADAIKATMGLLVIQQSVVKFFDRTLAAYFDKTRHRWFPLGHDNMALACLTALTSYTLPIPVDMLWTTDSFYGHAACAWGSYLSVCPAGSAVEEVALAYLRDDKRLKTGNMTAFMLQPSDMAYGFDVDQGLEAIHVCSIFGLTNLIQRLSPTNSDLNKRAPVYRRTPLSYACKKNHDQTVEVLLNLGADPNLQYDGGPTVLHEAIRLKHQLVVGLLLCSPVLSLTSLMTEENEGMSMLLSIVQLQAIAILKLALARPDLDINEKDNNGRTALWSLLSTFYHEQASDFQKGALELIVEDPRCDINAVDLGGRNYIMRVLDSRISSLELLDLLLDHGTDLNHKDDHGESAIFHAITLRYDLDMTSRLIRKGADLMVRNHRGQGLLHRLISDMEDSETPEHIVLLLNHMPGLVNLQDERGRTALHVALFLGKIHLAEELLDMNPNITISDYHGRTAFDIACQYGRMSLLGRLKPPVGVSGHEIPLHDSVEAINNETQLRNLPAWSLCFLEHLDILQQRLTLNDNDMLESSPDDGNTALHWLVNSNADAFELREKMREKILSEYLFDNPRRCSPMNLNQETPLHMAIRSDRTAMAKMLIDHGAELTIRDNLERTPLDLARELDRSDVVAILEDMSTKRSS